MKLPLMGLVLCLCLIFIQPVAAEWVQQDSGTLAWLQAVYFVDENTGWIAGSGGTLLVTSDGGSSWRQGKKFTSDKIRDVYFENADNGWLLCEQDIYRGGSGSPSYLMRTFDGGENWQKINFTENRDRILRVVFSKNGRGYAVGEGGTMLKTIDDGKSWKNHALPVKFLMLDGSFSDDLHGTLVGGGGTILYTADGGSSWNNATVPTEAKTKLTSVFFADQNLGWTAGAAGRISITSNGGKLWREQDSSTVENLFDILFVNLREGFAVGDNGTILRTTNGGNVWKQEKTNVKHRLERIGFAGQRGFAVGYGGTILMHAPPK